MGVNERYLSRIDGLPQKVAFEMPFYRYALFFHFKLGNFSAKHSRVFTRECNETSIAGSEKALTRSLDFVNYFIYGNYNVPYYNAADQCIT